MKKTLMIGMFAALLTTSAGAALANGIEVRADLGGGDANCATNGVSVGTWFGNTFGYDGQTFHVRDDRRFEGRREQRAWRGDGVAWRGDRDGGFRGEREGGWRGEGDVGFRGEREGGWRGEGDGGFRGERDGGWRGDRDGGRRGDGRGEGAMHEARRPSTTFDRRW